MKSIVIALALANQAAAGATAQPTSFDLACTGTPPESGNETSASFRIDLASGQFCSGSCESVGPIVEITDSRITLQVHRALTSMILGTETRWLDRVTGIYHDTIEIRGAGGDTFDHVMQCTPGPFSGFPATKF